MAKNIVLLSDGTGNSSAKIFKTNVWRLYQALDLTDPKKQIAFYDDGVGTDSNKYIAAVTGVFGFGLKRNVLDVYSFLCRNYEPGDRIYGFGFSRGAFTIRVIAGFVATQGIVRAEGLSEADLAQKALQAYRRYRARFHTAFRIEELFRWLRDLKSGTGQIVTDERYRPEIHFLGVWDTVDAYGGPIEEIVRGIDYWIWPLSMPDRLMSNKIRRACHAVALDDERRAFWPVLWNELYVKNADGKSQPIEQDWTPAVTAASLSDTDKQRLSQVWFTGMHTDVGGGYPQDGLSFVTLDWMMERALVYGLQMQPDEKKRLSLGVNPFDKLNNSRQGFASYYRYQPRKLETLYNPRTYRAQCARVWDGLLQRVGIKTPELRNIGVSAAAGGPMVHESVFRRIEVQGDGYAPIVFPESYRVAQANGGVGQHVYEHASQAEDRAHAQEWVWNNVWKRRVAYFATVLCSVLLALLPLIIAKWPWLARGSASFAEFLIPVIGLLSFLPDFLQPWISAAQRAPGLFLVLAILISLCMGWSGRLEVRIRDGMRAIWVPTLRSAPKKIDPRPLPGNWIYKLRNKRWYREAFAALTQCLLPTFFAAVIFLAVLYLAAAVISRTVYGVANVFGQVCPSGSATADPKAFLTNQPCQAIGQTVTKGGTYKVTLTIPADRPWIDSSIPTNPKGFGIEKKEAPWWMSAFVPFRRLAGSNWFATVARVGQYGFEEHVLEMKPDNHPCGCPDPDTGTYSGTFKARKSGEVFVFVNDAVIGHPSVRKRFYANNLGAATITMTEVSPPDKK